MTTPRIGIYPGSFDPLTNGHMEIIRRAMRVVDRLIVAVALNGAKDTAFSTDERVEMAREAVAPLVAKGADINVTSFEGLLVDFAVAQKSQVVIRGLRVVSDFEFEFQMTGMNARLNPDVETMFLMASDSHQFIASRFVKEVCRLGGDVSSFVPPCVLPRLERWKNAQADSV